MICQLKWKQSNKVLMADCTVQRNNICHSTWPYNVILTFFPLRDGHLCSLLNLDRLWCCGTLRLSHKKQNTFCLFFLWDVHSWNSVPPCCEEEQSQGKAKCRCSSWQPQLVFPIAASINPRPESEQASRWITFSPVFPAKDLDIVEQGHAHPCCTFSESLTHKIWKHNTRVVVLHH